MSERYMCNTSNQGRVRERQRVTMTERQQERETWMQHAIIQGRVRGGERDKHMEATRERETCNTSNQGRVRERERVTMIERH